MVPFQSIPNPSVKIVFPNPIQLIPLSEYAIVFVPCPTPTHLFGTLLPNVYTCGEPTLLSN
jgi:hypothetical protein